MVLISFSCLLQIDSYVYIEGMEEMLQRLKAAGYQVHAMSNYPSWYRYIESKLKVSRYVDWTFISCEGPMKVGVPWHDACSGCTPACQEPAWPQYVRGRELMIVTQLEGTAYKQAHPNFEKTDLHERLASDLSTRVYAFIRIHDCVSACPAHSRTFSAPALPWQHCHRMRSFRWRLNSAPVVG
jgi:hypothetical protein